MDLFTESLLPTPLLALLTPEVFFCFPEDRLSSGGKANRRIHRESVSGEAGFSLGGFDRVLYCKFKFGVQDSKRCVSPLRQRLAVVKWYRIDANWYKPDPTRMAQR